MISEWSTIVMFQAVQDSGRAGTFVSTLAAVEFLMFFEKTYKHRRWFMHRSFWGFQFVPVLAKVGLFRSPQHATALQVMFWLLSCESVCMDDMKAIKARWLWQKRVFEITTIALLSFGQLRQLWSTCFFRSFGLWIAYDDITVPMLLHGWGPYGSVGQDKLLCWLYFFSEQRCFCAESRACRWGNQSRNESEKDLGAR